MSVVVVGMAAYRQNRVWNNVELLVRSVRRNSPTADIALLTTQLGKQDRRLFFRHRVQPIEIVAELPDHDMKTDAGKDAMNRWKLEMFGARHALYLQAVQQLPHTHVLLTDTRDVVVTDDLAPACDAETLVLSQEDDARRIGDDPFNRDWILEGYGQAELERIGRQPILCAGAIFGPRAAITGYVEAMKAEVSRLGSEMTGNIGDQPLHNHLAYSGKIPPFTTSRAEDGWLRSIGLLATEAVSMEWAHARSSSTAHAVRVVHQYDRHLDSLEMRKAVSDVAGLGAWHPWRLDGFLGEGASPVARVLRRLYWNMPLVRR